MSEVTAIILCGGTGRRFGGDKTQAPLAGRPVLDHLLDGLPDDWPIVCVGPPRPTRRAARWVREEPPGGGPVAGLAAALPHVTSPLVVVLGGDMPYAGPAAIRLASTLASTLSNSASPPADDPDAAGTSAGAEVIPEAIAARDGEGRLQPLLAAYQRDALQRALPEPAAGTPLMRLLDAMRVESVAVEARSALDIDTAADLDEARHRLEP